MKVKNGWHYEKIGNICHVKHGYAFKGEFYSNSGKYILLTPGNFTESDGLKFRGNKEKYYIGKFNDDYLLHKGDMLVVMTDLKQSAPYLGAPGIVKDENLLHNQRLGLIQEIKLTKITPEYLYWVFQSDNYRGQIKGSATGSTVKHTSPDRIYNCDVLIPDNTYTQQKIASILSAFDDLIENNTKRIKILEKTAQLIYKEWFVDFKFPSFAKASAGRPNHEKVKMVESGTEFGEIPEGWEVKSLSEIADVNKNSVKRSDDINFINYVDIKSVKTGIIEETKPLPFFNAPSRARRLVKDRDIIWSTVRPNRMSYALVLNPDSNLIVSTGFAVLTANGVSFSYLYHFVTTDSFVAYLVGHATGAAYPAVSSETFKKAKILVPTNEILREFNDLVEPIHRQIKELGDLSKKLRQTRDLLLPKLVRGEVKVGDLDII